MTVAMARNFITGPLDPAEQRIAGDALQATLTDLIDLSLLAKQAHWNVVGRQFRSVHLQLDELVSSARQFADSVAERAAALGVSPDGRTATVAASSTLPQLPSGYITDDEVVESIVATLDTLVTRLRRHIDTTGPADPVTQDLLIEITAAFEQHRWMFRAQLAHS